MNLCCVHCGAPAAELHQSRLGSLRLCTCESCGEFVDELLELEPMIIGVKLFLQRKEVYRHFSRNSVGSLPLQVPVIFLLMDIALAWSSCCYEEDFEKLGETFKWNLFVTFISVLCGWTIYVFMIYIGVRLLSPLQYPLNRVLFVITVASFCKLFNIGVILWSTTEWMQLAGYGVELYWILAQYRMIGCILENRFLATTFVVGLSVYLKHAMSSSRLPLILAKELSHYLM